ncbi:MAG TPA: hypothetical protein VKV57_12085 [bacterium]|nr:hypothetical protein [bacterium]
MGETQESGRFETVEDGAAMDGRDRWAPAEPGEREVVIQFDMASGGMALVFTSWPGWYSKFRRNPSARLLEVHRDEQGRLTGADFELPVALVSTRSKRRSDKKVG